MATIQDAVNQVNALKDSNAALLAKVTTLTNAMTTAFNHLEQLIATGAEAQPVLDALAPIAQAISDATPGVDSAIAQAQTESTK